MCAAAAAFCLGGIMAPLAEAEAMCTYNVTFDVNPQQVSDTNTSLNLTTSVQQTGRNCNSYAYYVQFYAGTTLLNGDQNYTGYYGDFSTHKYTLSATPQQLGAHKKGDTVSFFVKLQEKENADATGLESNHKDVAIQVDLAGPAAAPPASGPGSTGLSSGTVVPPVDLHKGIIAGDLAKPVPYSFPDLINRTVSILFGLVGGIAVIFIIIGGFRLAFSQGNAEAVTAARKTITWAIIGLVVALMAFAIIGIVEKILY